MKRNSLGLFLILFASALYAQNVQLEWVKSMGGNYIDHGYSIAVDNNKNIFMTGSFQDSVDFDPGIDTLLFFANFAPSQSNGFILKLDSLGNLVWAKQLEGGSLSAGTIRIDSLDNVYYVGGYDGNVDLDLGAGTQFASGSNDCFISKLDNNGNFIWAKTFSGPGNAAINDFRIASDGNLILTGRFTASIDADPDGGTYNLNSNGSQDLFIIQLTNSGNLIWAGQIGGSFYEDLPKVSVDAINNIYISGLFNSTVDFDPGSGIYNLIDDGNNSHFITKWNSSGIFLWAKHLEDYNSVTSLELNEEGDLLYTGDFYDTLDIDPGASLYNLISGGLLDIYVSSLDSSGIFKWGINFTGSGSDWAGEIGFDTDENVYVCGRFDGLTDFNPGPGIFTYTTNWSDIFITKLNGNGNFIWAKQLGDPDLPDFPNDIEIDNSGNIYTTGFFAGIGDYDPGPDTMNLISDGQTQDIFIHKMSQSSCSNLTVVVDSLFNLSCLDSGKIYVHAENGFSPYTYSWNSTPADNDSVLSAGFPSIYSVSVSDYVGCSTNFSYLLKGPVSYSDFDLNVNLISSPFIPGINSQVILDGFNDGCFPITGELKLVYGNQLSFVNSAPIPDQIIGDTLIWNFSDLTYDSLHIKPVINFLVDSTAIIGDNICFKTIITPLAGDMDSINNIKDYCFMVQSSYDPNDKRVHPIGTCESGFILNSQKLTYTVRFQNTGNSPAIDIVINDSISQNLDINTIRIIGSSHLPVYAEIKQNNIVNFIFNEINLPDSTSNESESHGYLVYEIFPVAALSEGDIISNYAGIYFDFNEPIYTNSTFNTITNSLVPDITLSVNGNVLASNAINSTFQWINCSNDSLPISGEVNPMYLPAVNGEYALIITHGQCIDTSECVSVNSLVSDEFNDNKIVSIFPNPSSGVYNFVNLPDDLSSFSYQLFDVTNRLIFSGELTKEKEQKIDFSFLVPGIYVLNTRIGNFILIKE